MAVATIQQHKCFKCLSHEVQGPFRQQGFDDAPELESIDTTYSGAGDDVFFTSGYSALRGATDRSCLRRLGLINSSP
jgi:hypothetical protein